jgi:hypothetical protein
MDAGPELDALVATKVMGWHKANLASADAPDDCACWAWVDSAGEYQRLVSEWCPSAPDGIAAAWEVVEHLNWLQFTVARENCSGVRYDATCYNTFHCEPLFHAHADTAPPAICWAALKAKGVDPDA